MGMGLLRGGPIMSRVTNLDRARWAEAALDAFVDQTGVDEPADAVGDLIADLGHYCAAHGIDFLEVVRTGIGHWSVERLEPENLHAFHDVSITINRNEREAQCRMTHPRKTCAKPKQRSSKSSKTKA